jgi:hypothetical protein
MNKLKQHLLDLPKYLLIASVLFYWISVGRVMNPIAIGLLLVLVFQIIFKVRWLGVLIPGLLILISLYLLLALFSELSEFPSFNAEAQTLLFVGLGFLLSTLFISGVMIVKYDILPTRE